MATRKYPYRKRNGARREEDIPYPLVKRCSKCSVLKPAVDFPKARAENDGLKKWCKACWKASRHAWYLRNTEREIAKAAEWQTANPEKRRQIAKNTYYRNHDSRRARAKAGYEANRDRILEAERVKYAADKAHRAKKLASAGQYYQQNAPKVCEYQKRYKKANPVKAAVWMNDRRMREKNAPGSCTPAEWAAILDEFNYCCAYCLRHESVAGKMSIDHMTPLTRGGSNDPDNLVPACRSCNSSKHDKTVLEYLAYQAGNMMFS